MILTLMGLFWAVDYTVLNSKKAGCEQAVSTYEQIRSEYESFFRDCYDNYTYDLELCDIKERDSRYKELENIKTIVNQKCKSYYYEINMNLQDAENGMDIYCGSDDEEMDRKCDEYIDQYKEFDYLQMDAKSKGYDDDDGDGKIDLFEWDYNELCLDMSPPCDFIFRGESDKNINIQILQPSTKITMSNNGYVSIPIKVSINENVNSVTATVGQKVNNQAKIYPINLVNKNGYWENTLTLSPGDIQVGSADLEIEASYDGGSESKSISIQIIKEGTSDSGSNKEQTDKSNNSEEPKEENGEKNNSQGNDSEKSDFEKKLEDAKCNGCAESIFDGVRASTITSESYDTQKRIEDIAKNKKFKISFVDTPYGSIPVIEKPSTKEGILGYQEKKRVVNTSKSMLGKLLDALKEKFGITFGSGVAKYFGGKAIEEAVYNNDDKVEKTKEELGINGEKAKLFNDIINTNNRDAYKAISEEIPDNEVTKKAKEALDALEKLHDRSAAAGLGFEFETVKETVKGYAKFMKGKSPEEIKAVLRERAAENVGDYSGSIYHGNGLFVSNRFVNALPKNSVEGYNFNDPEDRGRYYFDVLWNSGQVQKWINEEGDSQ